MGKSHSLLHGYRFSNVTGRKIHHLSILDPFKPFQSSSLVGGLEDFFQFSTYWEIIVPTDFHFFQMGSIQQPVLDRWFLETVLPNRTSIGSDFAMGIYPSWQWDCRTVQPCSPALQGPGSIRRHWEWFSQLVRRLDSGQRFLTTEGLVGFSSGIFHGDLIGFNGDLLGFNNHYIGTYHLVNSHNIWNMGIWK